MFTHEARVRQVQSYSASAAFSVSSRPICVCSSSSMEQTMGTFVNSIWCLSIVVKGMKCIIPFINGGLRSPAGSMLDLGSKYLGQALRDLW